MRSQISCEYFNFKNHFYIIFNFFTFQLLFFKMFSAPLYHTSDRIHSSEKLGSIENKKEALSFLCIKIPRRNKQCNIDMEINKIYRVYYWCLRLILLLSHLPQTESYSSIIAHHIGCFIQTHFLGVWVFAIWSQFHQHFVHLIHTKVT